MNRTETATGTYSLAARTSTRVLSTQLDAQQAYIAQRYEDAYDRLIEATWDIEHDLKPLQALTGEALYAAYDALTTLTAKHKAAMNLVDLSIAHASRVYTHFIGSFDPMCHQDEDDNEVKGYMHVGEIARYREDTGAALEDAETRHEVRLAQRDERWYDDFDDFPAPAWTPSDEDLKALAEADRTFERFLRMRDEKEARLARALKFTDEEICAELSLDENIIKILEYRG